MLPARRPVNALRRGTSGCHRRAYLRPRPIAAPAARRGAAQIPAREDSAIRWTSTERGSRERARPSRDHGGRLRLVHVATLAETLGFLAGQVRFLRERGYEVHAVAAPGERLTAFAASEGAEVHGVPMERSITPARDLVAVARLWRLLRSLRPDVVDAHTPKGGLLGMIAARLAGVPVRVYHVHGLRYATARGPMRALLRATERLSAALATQVLCVSRSVAELAIRDGVVPRHKAKVLRAGSINGVDATGCFRPPDGEAGRRAAKAALGLDPDAPVLGYVGRLVREKGIVELLEAWRILREEWPRLRLVLVGPLEPHDPLPPAALEALASDPRICCAGVDWEPARWYAAMDVVTLPSWREGFGVVLLEAAAMGLPVVATSIPGCVDAVVDGVTGVLVPPRDPGALAAALRGYLADPALRARHGAAGRARALADFDPRQLWAALAAEYAAALGVAAGATPVHAAAR